ncbi:MAG: tannase/feruloyl esterase family alpha/beta hydrolase [Gammaproteobacteria bacterium]|nr:tannase/feruloyl esterase family alpha/beta hydrolase [Gammaproteobacteria bacterium]
MRYQRNETRRLAVVIRRLTGVVALAACAGLAACATQGARLRAGDCAGLQDLAIPARSIGLPTGGAVVQAAVAVAAGEPGNPNGDYCRVNGIVRPHDPNSPFMQFQVNLPLDWNGRALQFGGGAYDGTLVTGLGAFVMQPGDVPNALKQGYVTLGSDGGHQSGPGFDGRFGLNDEALINYGQQSVKKTHDAAVAILRAAYGREPRRFYFIGGSQGGHEALDAAARYPQDYDGVVAHYPAYNVTLLHLGSLNVGRALYQNGGAGWMNAAKTRRITGAVYASCDGLDGARDGIIADVSACKAAFDVTTLRCADGSDAGDDCLSDAQLAAVRQITSEYSPGFAVAGMDSFPGWPLLDGALFRVSNFGQVRQPANPVSGEEALLYVAGDQTAKFIITRNPGLDTLAFDPAQWRTRIAAVAAIMDVSDVSLARFRARGGRILLTHGTADDFITPYNTVRYYQQQVRTFGQAGTDAFMRFYLIPGFGHGFGPFDAKFDSLQVLRDWVEQGRAPAQLLASDGNPGVTRTRPLCDWPRWPKFTGAPGTENQAASFTCTAPQAH